MPDEKTSKKKLPTNREEEPTSAPEVPDEMKLKIVDSTADGVPEPEDKKENEEPETDTDESQASEEDNSADSAEDETSGLGDEEQVMGDDEPPKSDGKIKRFFKGYWRHKKWTLPLTALAIVALLGTVPWTRYKLLGLALKRSYSVAIIDSKTSTPVSGAKVMLDGQTATTDSEGKATIKAKVGKRSLSISKKYYKDVSKQVFVGLRKQSGAARVELDATGRQVPIKVVNKITNKPVRDADVKVLDTEAKTDADGMATIVLPTTAASQQATVTASGYNKLATKVQVTDKVAKANTLAITPSGRVYFLSNLSGNIDVVSSNLDGTSRQTVLAGTGREDPNNTVLLASRDWKYLALLSKRDGDTKLYLINTATGDHSVMDEGSDVDFSLVGWSDHYFVYGVDRTKLNYSQANRSALKSFNAETGKIGTLDQTSAEGSKDDYAYQTFAGGSNIRIAGDNIVYVKQWNASFGSDSRMNGKKDVIMSIRADGSHRQTLTEIAMSAKMSYNYFSANVYKPNVIYYQFNTNNGATYYEYKNGYVTQSNTVTSDAFSKNYPTYLISPSDDKAFWADTRDGKNTLFVGNGSGDNGTQIASLSDYQAYGWFSDNYVLASKNGSELYIMPTSGGKALKITDYYKVARPYNGYGYGYGGL